MPKIAKYEKSDKFNQVSFSSLDLACDIALEIDINVISSKLFHCLPCFIPINPNVVIPLDNFLIIILVPRVKLSPSVGIHKAFAVIISLLTTFTLGMEYALTLNGSILGIEMLVVVQPHK